MTGLTARSFCVSRSVIKIVFIVFVARGLLSANVLARFFDKRYDKLAGLIITGENKLSRLPRFWLFTALYRTYLYDSMA